MSEKKWPRRWARIENADSIFGAEFVEKLPGFPDEEYIEYLSLAEHQAIIADLEKKLAVAKGALEKSSNFIIQDGCEECSSIWERSYQFKPAIEALAAIEQGETK